ncbi:hypothetical protein U1Q18_024181 [Sarracenia purpurea var. burkii]
MLGPSGSGKTTLITALGGRLRGQIAGTIYYNGEPFSSTIKRNIGFVTQDDVLYPHLTVAETLLFTALLRLPNTLPKHEKIAQSDAVISELGLAKIKNSVVGAEEGEYWAGDVGESELDFFGRADFGAGLDDGAADSDDAVGSGGGREDGGDDDSPAVLLLSEGNVLYFGKGAEAMDYFSGIGYSPSVVMNPSDFLLDLANGVSSDDSREDPTMLKHALVSAFKNNLAETVKAEVQETGGSRRPPVGVVEDKEFGRWTTTWWQQFRVLLRRGVKERKHNSFSGLKIGQVLVVAFLSGFLWWQSDISHLQDQIGLLFFYSGFWGFFPLFEAIFTFPQERMMLEKERSSGMYRLSSYFMARIVGDLPIELVLPTIFVSITYWMAGLKPAAANFCRTLFSLLLTVLVSQGLGLALGAVVMDQKSATTLGSVVMLSFLLAGGYYVQQVPAFISWIKYVSISHYAYKLLLGSQFDTGETYSCSGNRTCLVGDFPSIKVVGLDAQVVSVGALVVMLVGYRLVAYVALMRIGVTTSTG